jgi:hypothetical protein
MKRQQNDQAKQDNRWSDLDPNDAAEFSQHYLKPRTPRLRHLISDGFDRQRHES